MGDTKIEWTDKTWNPVRGCTRVSPGCVNCYAERMAARFSDEGMPYEGLAQITKSGPRWTGKVQLVEEMLDAPLRWKKPQRIFVNSMSDLFHDEVPFEFVMLVFTVMSLCPQHTFQVLTKRPERMLEYFQWSETEEASDAGFNVGGPWICGKYGLHGATAKIEEMAKQGWPLSNVWLGVSAENQEWADKRIPLLMQCPAAVRWVSAEPLLGPLDLRGWVRPFDVARDPLSLPCLDWLVCGGESGPGARPMHPDWARSLRDQCEAAGVAFHFKQWGAWMPIFSGIDPSKNDPQATVKHGFTFPDGKHLWFVGKKAAGRELDGREWSEFPTPSPDPAPHA